MTRKKLICMVLSAAMILALTACGSTAASAVPQTTQAPLAQETTEAPQVTDSPEATEDPAAAQAAEPELPQTDVDVQLDLIYSQIDTLIQEEEELPWFYAVTDLDHDDTLEFVAASQHPQDRSTNLKIWASNADRTALEEIKVVKDEDESFPDIMTDCTDTFYDKNTDTWFYLFYDNVIISPTDIYTQKSAFNLKDGAISYEPFAVEHTVVENNLRVVTHTDNTGMEITQAVYNAAGVVWFAGMDRSSTNYEWLTKEEVRDLHRLRESIAVFQGLIDPTETFPVPRPEAMDHPEATPTPAPVAPTATPTATPVPTAAPSTAPVYLTITKNPTNEENRMIGGKANFVACANAFESLAWTVVDPMGNTYTPQQVADMFGTTVSGAYSSTLTFTVTQNMHNFGVYCTFYYKNQTARTTTAYIHIKDAPAPTPTAVTSDATVRDWNYGAVILRMSGGITVSAPWEVISMDGHIYDGAPAKVTWVETPDGGKVISCTIAGRIPDPTPAHASMSGTIFRDTASTVYVVLSNGAQLHLDARLVEIMEGSEYNNAPCVVYYVDTPTEETIYKIDVFGYDPEPDTKPEPAPDSKSYYVVPGTSYHDTAFTLFVRLDNGTELTLDADRVEVIIKGGTEIEGAACTVYYTDALSADSVYKVEINAYDPLPEPEAEPGNEPAEPDPEPDIPEPDPEPDIPEAESEPEPELTVESVPEVAEESAPNLTAVNAPESAEESAPESTEENIPEPTEESTPEPTEEPEPAPVVQQSYSVDGRAFKETDGRILITLPTGETAHVSATSQEGYKITIKTASGDVALAGSGNPCQVFYYDSFADGNIYEVVISEE